MCVKAGHAQNLYDINRSPAYKRVFVDTDNFGLSYLEDLERIYPRVSVDSVRYAVLNDLAYYWHTRDLNKSLEFTKEGLELTRGNQLWQGRFQITQGAVLLRMEKLDSAIVVLQQAKSKVSKADLPFLFTQMGYVYERKGDLMRAADYALENKGLAEELQDVKALAVAYSDLSNLFWKHEKYEKGLEYGSWKPLNSSSKEESMTWIMILLFMW